MVVSEHTRRLLPGSAASCGKLLIVNHTIQTGNAASRDVFGRAAPLVTAGPVHFGTDEPHYNVGALQQEVFDAAMTRQCPLSRRRSANAPLISSVQRLASVSQRIGLVCRAD